MNSSCTSGYPMPEAASSEKAVYDVMIEKRSGSIELRSTGTEERVGGTRANLNMVQRAKQHLDEAAAAAIRDEMGDRINASEHGLANCIELMNGKMEVISRDRTAQGPMEPSVLSVKRDDLETLQDRIVKTAMRDISDLVHSMDAHFSSENLKRETVILEWMDFMLTPLCARLDRHNESMDAMQWY
eukprot:CAMPEP_0168368464 /NCGR_PEP_ID=MMETSP0228-20121227/6264_1 /TAXON_ID=133427 /ORGANISM="Protoceratium reticulatum, Strain CCCM 535 (=CCMP 1889)" /LENGTH=185 /DNA_ID=CAMNT_0008381311 /DNA_START=70 /DNA_END=627 /DNA_ORIENTATION=+